MQEDDVKNFIENSEDKVEAVNFLKECVFKYSPVNKNPVDMVRWVPIEKVRANDYNPNEVATVEMNLLYISIDNDGYTQPIVTVYDKEHDVYEIVDGFHRYSIMKRNKDIFDKCGGRVPVTVIDKPMGDRIASTIRHNRARGKHNVKGQSGVVFRLLKEGWEDSKICKELGMEPEELLRLKHITGFSKLFDNVEYSMAWKTTKQIEVENKHGYEIKE